MSEAEDTGGGGGAVGKLWRKHGGGYYALLAVGTFLYLEVQSLVESFTDADGVKDFLSSEILEAIFTFGIQTFVNSFLAGVWPWMWMTWMGLVPALAWAGGGYAIWAIILAWFLARREKELRQRLGL